MHLGKISGIVPSWVEIRASNERLEVTVYEDDWTCASQLREALEGLSRPVHDLRDARGPTPMFDMVITRERLRVKVSEGDAVKLDLAIETEEYDLFAAVLDETASLARVRRDFHDGETQA